VSENHFHFKLKRCCKCYNLNVIFLLLFPTPEYSHAINKNFAKSEYRISWPEQIILSTD